MDQGIKIELTVNGRPVSTNADPGHPLLAFLRDDLGLTGTKDGCSEGTCGTCTVIVDGVARRSCTLPLKRVNGSRVETIENLADDTSLHPLQAAMVRQGAIQCGFCTPGVVMAGKALLDSNPTPNVSEIKKALQPNICRCTGYRPIFVAVQEAAELLGHGVTRVPRRSGRRAGYGRRTGGATG